MIALSCIAAGGVRAADVAPPVTQILAAYARATHVGEVDVDTVETIGTLSGEGLTGTFHSWRSGDNERDDETLGPQSETTLRIGDRIWVRNSSGDVQELTGILRRRALTNEFIDSGDFVKAPERARFVAFGTVGDRKTWNVEVNAAGGEPETLWIDTETGLPLRTEYLDGDGPTYVDLSDWRDAGGMKVAFHAVTTDGEHEYDTIQQTTSIAFGTAIAASVFAPLVATPLEASGVQTVPLIDDGTRIECSVRIGANRYAFLIDSGSGNVVLDSRVAHAEGLDETGALEVRGAVRTGGMHLGKLPRLSIGTAALTGLVVSTIDLSEPGQRRTDGILGYPFFASSEVQLDFPHHLMRFGPPGSFPATGDRLTIDTDRDVPEAVLRVGNTVDAPFIFDTGNSGEVLVYAPFADKYPALVPANGSGASSYVGVGGSDRTYGARITSLRLGSTTLSGQYADVVVAKSGAFADRIDAGNIGLGVLRKFVVTFDYAGHALYLDRPRL